MKTHVVPAGRIAPDAFRYFIPYEKVTEVFEFITKLQNRHPKMKRERVMRKAAERFKLKLNKPPLHSIEWSVDNVPKETINALFPNQPPCPEAS